MAVLVGVKLDLKGRKVSVWRKGFFEQGGPYPAAATDFRAEVAGYTRHRPDWSSGEKDSANRKFMQRVTLAVPLNPYYLHEMGDQKKIASAALFYFRTWARNHKEWSDGGSAKKRRAKHVARRKEQLKHMQDLGPFQLCAETPLLETTPLDLLLPHLHTLDEWPRLVPVHHLYTGNASVPVMVTFPAWAEPALLRLLVLFWAYCEERAVAKRRAMRYNRDSRFPLPKAYWPTAIPVGKPRGKAKVTKEEEDNTGVFEDMVDPALRAGAVGLKKRSAPIPDPRYDRIFAIAEQDGVDPLLARALMRYETIMNLEVHSDDDETVSMTNQSTLRQAVGTEIFRVK
jgi:hypothetical protein